MVLAGELLLLERRDGRVYFLFQSWDNSFCDLKISAAPPLWGFQLSAVRRFFEFEPAPLVGNEASS
jgi:hypothetical protein